MQRFLFQISVFTCGRSCVDAVLRAWVTPRLEPVVLSEAERLTLENGARRRSTGQRLAVRARIVPA
ncbi:hypothetical protein ACFU7C_19775, partial [Streptomyces bacillaris]